VTLVPAPTARPLPLWTKEADLEKDEKGRGVAFRGDRRVELPPLRGGIEQETRRRGRLDLGPR